jgi:hypothetical protein
MPSKTLPSELLASPAPQDPPELPGLRLIKVPDAAPPYDCETHGTACLAMRDAASADPHGTLQSPKSTGLLEANTHHAALRTEPAQAPGAPALPAPPPASSASAGTSTAFTRQFAQAIVEILAGSRSPRQIVRWTTDRSRTQVELLTPLFAGEQRPRIRRILTSQPAARIVEMTVVVSFGPRTRALAIRFEHTPAQPATPGRPARPARWLCTELEAG